MNARCPSYVLPRTAGTTLVEVLLAVSILGILAVGGTGYFYHSRAGIEQSRNRRTALEAGVGRLEALRQALYESIAPTNLDYSVHYLQLTNGALVAGTTDPQEKTVVNGKSMPITTTVRYLDVETGETNSFDYLSARVEVGYRAGRAERVVMETRIAP